ALLIRYEAKALNWLCLNIIGIAVCFVRKINRQLKC
ncbi:IS5/IS1182 family transposase, partial [Emticicia sp. C21]